MSYFNKNGVKKVKDVLIMDSGSFGYSRLLTTGRVPSNMIYKIVDVDPVFETLVAKKSVNYMNTKNKRTVMGKYNYESIHNKFNPLKQMLENAIDESYEKTLKKYYANYSKIKSKEFVAKKRNAVNNEKELAKSEE